MLTGLLIVSIMCHSNTSIGKEIQLHMLWLRWVEGLWKDPRLLRNNKEMILWKTFKFSNGVMGHETEQLLYISCFGNGDYGFGTLTWFFLYNYLIRFFCLWFMSGDNLPAMLPFQRLISNKYDTIGHKPILDAAKFITVWKVLCDGFKFTLRYVYEHFLILFMKFWWL